MDKKLFGALIALATILGGLFGAFVFPNDVIVEKTVIEKVPVEKIVEVPEIVEVEKEIEVLVEVPVEVDNGNLNLVLEYIYDNELDEDLIEELDDDELGLIIDRIIFLNNVKDLAIDAVSEEFRDLIDHKKVAGYPRLDDDDVERINIKDDVNIYDIDYVYFDAKVKVKVYFEQDNIEYKAFFDVEIKDSKVEDVDFNAVMLR